MAIPEWLQKMQSDANTELHKAGGRLAVIGRLVEMAENDPELFECVMNDALSFYHAKPPESGVQEPDPVAQPATWP